MNGRLFMFGFTIFFLLACATMRTPSSENSPRLTLAKVSQVVPGITTSNEILKSFGQPADKIDLKEVPELLDGGVLWRYTEGANTRSLRAAFYFKKGASVVGSVTWTMRNGDSEQNLDVAELFVKQRFPAAQMQIREKRWGRMDMPADNTVYYEDPKFGVVIFFNKVLRKVSSITWTEPKLFAEMAYKLTKPTSCQHGVCIQAKDEKSPASINH